MLKSIPFLVVALTFGIASTLVSKEPVLEGFTKERIELAYPLLLVKGSKGFLACGYINVETCNKTKEACAIVTGVKTHEDMLVAEVKAVSETAQKLGITVGMKGEQALARMK